MLCGELTMAGEVRTGQAHRTLMGHTAPVTCLQFDEMHIVSGSLDKTMRVRAVPFACMPWNLPPPIDMGPTRGRRI